MTETVDRETVQEAPGDLGPPVDPADQRQSTFPRPGSVETLAPVLPEWARTRQTRRALARWSMRWLLHQVAYHVIRSPKYALRVSWWSLRGAGRIGWRLTRWLADSDGRLARGERKDLADARLLVEQHDRHVKHRLVGTVLMLVLLATGAALAWVLAPRWVVWAVLAVVVGSLAVAGKPGDQPVTDRVQAGPTYRRLTAELVRKTLTSIGVAAMKDPASVSFPKEIHRDGPGYLALVDLPAGVEAVDVVERRGRLASALRLPMDQVWPSPDDAHAGRLALWVGDMPASKTKHPSWPLLRSGRADLFSAFPVATDPRLRPVKAGMISRNFLVGGVPGSGKSAAIRVLLLAAALDPRTELHVYELKGSGDFDPLETVCSSFGSGADDDTADAALGALRWARRECGKRAKVVKQMAADGRAPDNKITPKLAGDPSAGLHPVVVAVDEAQELFADKQRGSEAAELATAVVKLGRALGVILIIGTQRPDKESLPTGLSANVNTRMCFAVQDQVANDMILGTSAYKLGHRATAFRPEVDAGWHILKGVGSDTLSARTFYVDTTAAKKVVARAVTLRDGKVSPTTTEDVTARRLADDTLSVWPAGAVGTHWHQLALLLRKQMPEHYPDATAESVSARLRSLGVPSENVKAAGTVRKGCRLDQVRAVGSGQVSREKTAQSRE